MRDPVVYAFVLLGMMVSLVGTPVAARDTYRPHAAHVHGLARLDIAIDGHELVIELDTPVANVAGFEHAAQNAQQRATVEAALARLRDGNTLFIVNDAADCSIETVAIDAPLMEIHTAERASASHSAHDTHDSHLDNTHDPHKHGHRAHSDLVARYTLHCYAARHLEWLEVQLFEHFHALERLNVQWISADGQGATTLTRNNMTINF